MQLQRNVNLDSGLGQLDGGLDRKTGGESLRTEGDLQHGIYYGMQNLRAKECKVIQNNLELGFSTEKFN